MPATAPPTDAMRFRWAWRPYQERALATMEAKLRDRRLHIVAAPGSGKTCLGLEIFRRMALPTVVLSPTRTIRDQWLARLADFVAPHDTTPGWAGRSLIEPGFFTSITYQSLHAEIRPDDAEGDESADDVPQESELDTVVKRLRIAKVGMIILDEAHHLRREWWDALRRLIEPLDGLILVSLTATPPYDVVGSEWAKYESLCGPIDHEIAVPELVRGGTLCPHDDFVWVVTPPREDADALRAFDKAGEKEIAEALERPDLAAFVTRHPWLTAETPDAEAILERPEIFTAMLSYLVATHRPVPDACLRLIDCSADELPPFDRRLCTLLVREQHHPGRSRALLEEDPSLLRRLRLTPAKIDGCVGIHRLEREVRGTGLCQVFLTDFIGEGERDRVAAWPLFQALVKRAASEDVPAIALMTGRCTLVHETVADEISGEAVEDPDTPGFRRVASPALVSKVTELLSRGRIRALVSTRSLLGEGWDAPCVNSLVLVSYVGSYMSTNQMRGRALRTDPSRSDKCASIWHVVAVDASTPAGTWDHAELSRRFDTFVGLAFDRPIIESGLERLGLPRHVEINATSEERLRQIASLPARWSEAIEAGSEGRVIPCLTTPRRPPVRTLLFGNTLTYGLLASLGGAVLMAARLVVSSARSASPRDVPWVLIAAGVAGIAAALPGLARSAILLARCLPVDGSIRQVGLAVRDALIEARLIQDRPHGGVGAEEIGAGVWSVRLTEAGPPEARLFVEAMDDVLGPIENPRYVLSRSRWGLPFGRRDYHAVPRVFGENKERATAFHRCWKARLGASELIFTRNPEGRRLLLAARGRSFSTAMLPPQRRLSRWQ